MTLDGKSKRYENPYDVKAPLEESWRASAPQTLLSSLNELIDTPSTKLSQDIMDQLTKTLMTAARVTVQFDKTTPQPQIQPGHYYLVQLKRGGTPLSEAASAYLHTNTIPKRSNLSSPLREAGMALRPRSKK